MAIIEKIMERCLDLLVEGIYPSIHESHIDVVEVVHPSIPEDAARLVG